MTRNFNELDTDTQKVIESFFKEWARYRSKNGELYEINNDGVMGSFYVLYNSAKKEPLGVGFNKFETLKDAQEFFKESGKVVSIDSFIDRINLDYEFIRIDVIREYRIECIYG